MLPTALGDLPLACAQMIDCLLVSDQLAHGLKAPEDYLCSSDDVMTAKRQSLHSHVLTACS